MIRILHIEDDPFDAELVARELSRAGILADIRVASIRSEIIAELERFKPQVILSDYNMISFTGEEALALAQKISPETPFIFISGGIGEDHAIQLLKNGAKDYVLKDRPGRLPTAILRALEEVRAITEAREMENHLRRAQKMEAVGTLAAGVAHEINNPLTYVLSSLEALRDDAFTANPAVCPGKSECHDQVTAAIEGVLRIREIVRNLKTFARSDENDPPHPVDVVKAAERAIAMAMPQVRHRVRVVRELSRLPAVLGHEGRLGQVILNLVVNASQAMPDDNPKKNTVIVRTKCLNDEAIVEIADNGPGIEQENIDRIFDPYFTTKPVDVGTGLGLAICRSIIEGHGGTIEVESLPGLGATFRIKLPTVTDAVAPMENPEKVKRSGRRALRILLVDDEPSIRRSTGRVLGQAGHSTVTASNGAEALEILEGDSEFDLILSDLHMPEVSGQDLYEELMKRNPALAARIVFMTGGAVLSGPRQFLDVITNPRIDKPFESAELLRLIDSAVAIEPNDQRN